MIAAAKSAPVELLGDMASGPIELVERDRISRLDDRRLIPGDARAFVQEVGDVHFSGLGTRRFQVPRSRLQVLFRVQSFELRTPDPEPRTPKPDSPSTVWQTVHNVETGARIGC